MSTVIGRGASSRRAGTAAWLAIVATCATIVLLGALHILSPEFAPSWRMVSEYAFGHHAAVLSMMFLCWGIGTWALAAAIWGEIQTTAGKVGLGFLILAGVGEAMASVFDVRHEVGHGIAGAFGVLGFPVAALLLSVALGRKESWRNVRRPLLWLANLSWISILLLIATMIVMVVQLKHANGGHLPQHAPKTLPSGVLALDGWADRLIVLTNCAWVLVAAWHAIRVRNSSASETASGSRLRK